MFVWRLLGELCCSLLGCWLFFFVVGCGFVVGRRRLLLVVRSLLLGVCLW